MPSETIEVAVPTVAEVAPTTQQEIARILVFAEDLVVASDEEAAEATELLARIDKITKSVKEARLRITRPLDQAKKAAIEQEKAAMAPLEPVEQLLRKGIGEYEAEKQRKIREAAERAERERREKEERARREAEEAERKAREAEEAALAAQAAGDEKSARQLEKQAEEAAEAAEAAEIERFASENSPAPVIHETGPVRTDAGTVSVRMVWKFEVENPDEVPREFCQPVDKLIREAVKNGAREIPGVRVFEEAQTTVRSK